MKKSAFLAVCLLLAASPCFAWRLASYSILMNIQPDSSVQVTETVRADFTGEYKHGIFRDIPLVGSDSWGNRYKIRLDQIYVTDGNGVAEQIQTSRQSGNLHIRIGDPGRYVQGVHTYLIRYRLLRAVHFFNDHDELYWNAVGDKWDVAVENAVCEVVLPSAIPAGRLKVASFTGNYGSKSADAVASTPDSRTAKFVMTRPLNPGEFMTVVVGWPKGVVTPPSFAREAMWFMADNGFVFLPIVFLAFLLALWTRAGRDPQTGRSEAVMYDPPDNLRPAEMGSLVDERADMRDISATIVDLAVRGYIHIKAEVDPGFLTSKKDYELKLLKPVAEVQGDLDLTYFERRLIKAIFGPDDTKWISSLKYDFYKNLPGLKDVLYDSLVKHGYFGQRPDSVRTGYLGAGIVVAVLGLGSLIFCGSGGGPLFIPVGWSIAVMLCGGLLALAARAMPRKTVAGRNAFVAARGFEEYLARAERGLIEYQERQGYFEKFLPYAMAFGIADRWARAFEGLQTVPPTWYSGAGGMFRPTIFAHDMVSASDSWGSAMVAQPRSSGSGSGGFFSGGSGFSGGSSGGGGGGGGGGSW